MPASKLRQWYDEKNRWVERHPKPWDEATEREYHATFTDPFEEWLDQGMGSCLLKDAENARIVADALLFFCGKRYELATFTVMPSHVHVLFSPRGGHSIKDILKSWKGFTAHEINKRMGTHGALWQEECWDRLVRNEKHYFMCADYIRKNPDKAGLKEGFLTWDRGTRRLM